MTQTKQDFFKTARVVATGEYVSVKHIGEGDYKVTFQSGSTAFMPEQENGVVYLDSFCL
jgi:hypothetical protein